MLFGKKKPLLQEPPNRAGTASTLRKLALAVEEGRIDIVTVEYDCWEYAGKETMRLIWKYTDV